MTAVADWTVGITASEVTESARAPVGAFPAVSTTEAAAVSTWPRIVSETSSF